MCVRRGRRLKTMLDGVKDKVVSGGEAGTRWAYAHDYCIIVWIIYTCWVLLQLLSKIRSCMCLFTTRIKSGHLTNQDTSLIRTPH